MTDYGKAKERVKHSVSGSCLPDIAGLAHLKTGEIKKRQEL